MHFYFRIRTVLCVKNLNMKVPSRPSLVSLPIVTKDGTFVALYSERGLAELDFPKSRRATSRSKKSKTAKEPIRSWHRLTKTALIRVLAGHAPDALPPLDWDGKTEFQQAVWREMLQIACGETRSYGQLAQNLGRPAASRAVGGACGANPIPVLVPCHRVLAANGRLGGFSAGLDWKRLLL